VLQIQIEVQIIKPKPEQINYKAVIIQPLNSKKCITK